MADLLDAELRRDRGRPLLTWYDERTGERVELSVTTYANWVAKTASLLVEEHDLERGEVVLVDLPVHWLGPVFLGAAWLAGIVVTFPSRNDAASVADAVVCGPAGLARWAGRADDVPVLACSLLPMGVRFADPLPPGVHDVGIDVWSQPDAFVALDPPSAGDPAVVIAGRQVTQGELFASPTAPGQGSTKGGSARGGRVVTALNPASPPGVSAFAGPLSSGGSLVLVSGAGTERMAAIAAAERATVTFEHPA